MNTIKALIGNVAAPGPAVAGSFLLRSLRRRWRGSIVAETEAK